MKPVASSPSVSPAYQSLSAADTSSIRKYFDRTSVQLSQTAPTNSVPTQSLQATTTTAAPVAVPRQRVGFMARCRTFMQNLLPGRRAPRQVSQPAAQAPAPAAPPPLPEIPTSAHAAIRARLPALERCLKELSNELDEAAHHGRGRTPDEIHSLDANKYCDYIRAFVTYQVSREICCEISPAECDQALEDFMKLRKHLPVEHKAVDNGQQRFGRMLTDESAPEVKSAYYRFLYAEAIGDPDYYSGAARALSEINQICETYTH